MPDRLLVLGGKRRESGIRGGRPVFHRAIAAAVDIRSGEVESLYEYRSPPERLAATGTPPQLFKAGTLGGDRLFVCTETEVLVLSLPELTILRRLSLPCFNDLHHVRPYGENLLVVSTGLDLVLEVDPRDEIQRAWNVLGEDPWQAVDPTIDYRRVGSTKPHRSHPNFVFVLDDQIWATRFEQRDAIRLSPPGKRIEIGHERVHDGIVFSGGVYFTTVDGRVAIHDPKAGSGVRLIDLGRLSGSSHLPGWCRGLLVLDPRRVVVGFSRLRPTRARKSLRWLAGRIGVRQRLGQLPTRIACFDLEREELLWEHSLEGIGMGAVFSIHPCRETLRKGTCR